MAKKSKQRPLWLTFCSGKHLLHCIFSSSYDKTDVPGCLLQTLEIHVPQREYQLVGQCPEVLEARSTWQDVKMFNGHFHIMPSTSSVSTRHMFMLIMMTAYQTDWLRSHQECRSQVPVPRQETLPPTASAADLRSSSDHRYHGNLHNAHFALRNIQLTDFTNTLPVRHS